MSPKMNNEKKLKKSWKKVGLIIRNSANDEYNKVFMFV